jgi:hypothetical protein
VLQAEGRISMIETIYSNENGEGCLGKMQVSFRMPKNVRQIGKNNLSKKIYVEDYVMSFIKQIASSDFSRCKIAVLVGQCIRLDNCRNIFISGAVEVKDIDPSTEITFTNDTWTSIYEEIKKYFVETEIVGWFIGGPGYLLEDFDKITKAHVNNFAGQDKTLLTYDNMEKEECFYSYENNRLTKLEGYYIYYEKNEEMQTYMIEHKNPPQSNEAVYDDKVSRDIRTVLQNKKQITAEENRTTNRLMYAAGTLLAVIVLVVGAAILNNYDQMRSMQDTLNYLSQNMEQVQSIFSDGKSSNSIDSQTTVAKGQPFDTTDAQEELENNDPDGQEEEESLDVEVAPGKVNAKADEEESTDDEINDEESNSNKDTSTAEEKGTSKAASNQGEKNKAQKGEIKYYIVKSGDTLADISYQLYKTYTKVEKIMELNNIEDQDLIYVGQKLIVP